MSDVVSTGTVTLRRAEVSLAASILPDGDVMSLGAPAHQRTTSPLTTRPHAASSPAGHGRRVLAAAVALQILDLRVSTEENR